MSASLMTHEHSPRNRHAAVPQLPPAFPPFAPKVVRTPSVESLPGEALSAATASSTDHELMTDPRPGIFLGLRVALLFNAGVGVMALLAYEGWMLLAR